MNSYKLSLGYLVTYLAIGGLGFALLPTFTMKLFLANGDYGIVMPRVVGMFMLALSYLLLNILRRQDWKYYPATIQVRSIIVLFLIYLYFTSRDPMFILLNIIVLIGLLPSIYIHYFQRKG